MGTIIREENFIPQLNREGKIRIYLPESYKQSDKNYPVIYMHDGQNLFDKEASAFGTIWNVHNILAKFEEAAKPKEFIVVGIDTYEDRSSEYSPWEYENTYNEIAEVRDYESKKIGGKGAKYAEYIVDTLKPYIDNKYRTLSDKNNTWLIGSSMGGLISLYIGFRFPEIFGKIGAVSTAVWFAEKSLLEYCKTPGENQRVYMDIGTNETSEASVENFPKIYLDGAVKLAKIVEDNIDDKNNMKFVIDEGGIHNEKDWEKRLPSIIEWLDERNT